jgi:hypothetical protein
VIIFETGYFRGGFLDARDEGTLLFFDIFIFIYLFTCHFAT